MLDRVTEYAQRVVSGEVVCGELHRLACKRHLDDLNHQNTSDFPYYWSIKKATDIIEFAETLTIAEGEEPKPVKLIPSQVFDLGCTFGWLKTSNHKRRFRRRYKSVARQNGKTFENGIMGTYFLSKSACIKSTIYCDSDLSRSFALSFAKSFRALSHIIFICA